jgi:hypothetical protein
MNASKWTSTFIIGAAIAVLAFASGERYARIGLVGAADLPTMPRASDMVIVREGTDFIVPAGMSFVLRGMGCAGINALSGSNSIHLSTVDLGIPTRDHFIRTGPPNSNDPVLSVEVPIGWAYTEGTTIRVEDNSGTDQLARAWGYLEVNH